MAPSPSMIGSKRKRIMSIELEQLKQIIAIDRCKTLSAAADELHISQPALSRSVQRMEDELCVSLFDRSKNKMQLNDTGKLFVKYADRMVDTESEMVRAVRNFDRSQRTIAIGTCAPAPVWFILPLISSLYPEMAVSTELGMTEDVLNAFDKGIYQLAIIPYELKRDDIVCTHFIDEELYFALPKDHKYAGKKALHMSDMDGETMLLFSGIGFWYNMHREKMPHTHYLMQNERDAYNEIAKSSTIPCFASNLGISHDRTDSGRAIVPIIDEESRATFYCICHTRDFSKYKALFDSMPVEH